MNIRIVETLAEFQHVLGLPRAGQLLEPDLDTLLQPTDLPGRRRRDAEVLCTLAANVSGACLEPLSEAEILAAAGLAYGGADTLVSQLGPLDRFAEAFPAPGEPLFTDGFECGSAVAWTGGSGVSP